MLMLFIAPLLVLLFTPSVALTGGTLSICRTPPVALRSLHAGRVTVQATNAIEESAPVGFVHGVSQIGPGAEGTLVAPAVNDDTHILTLKAEDGDDRANSSADIYAQLAIPTGRGQCPVPKVTWKEYFDEVAYTWVRCDAHCRRPSAMADSQRVSYLDIDTATLALRNFIPPSLLSLHSTQTSIWFNKFEKQRRDLPKKNEEGHTEQSENEKQLQELASVSFAEVADVAVRFGGGQTVFISLIADPLTCPHHCTRALASFSTLHDVIKPLLAPTRTRCFLVVQTSTSMFEVVPRLRIINGSSPFSTLQTGAMVAPFPLWSSRYIFDLLLHHGVFGDVEQILRLPTEPSTFPDYIGSITDDASRTVSTQVDSHAIPFHPAEIVFASAVRSALRTAYERAAEWDRIIPDRHVQNQTFQSPADPSDLTFEEQTDWFSATWLQFSAFGMCVWCVVGILSCL